MKEKIKNMTVSWIVLAVLYILLGISLAVWPDVVMSVICYAFGAILLLYGVFAIYGFYRRKEHKASSLLTLFLGIVSAALGMIMIIYPATVQSVIFVILGLYIVIDSILNIRRILGMRRLDYSKWKIHLVLSITAAALGGFVACYPLLAETTIFRSVGFILIFVGGTDLWTLIQGTYLSSQSHELSTMEDENVAER